MTAPSSTTRRSTISRMRGGRVAVAVAVVLGSLSGLVPALATLTL